jgi:methylmalonyl-CoA mutase C-terminal domain/subunit
MEVIYTGLRQSPEQIIESSIQEDVDVIALSILSGAHDFLLPRVMELLEEKGVRDVLVIAGGIIPEEDVADLKKIGIAEIFGPGTYTDDIITFIKSNLKR